MGVMKLICIKCNRDLSINNFYKNKANRSGIQQPCKDCKREYQVNYNLEHKEHRDAYMFSYHREPKVNERRRDYSKKYYTKNKEKQSDYYKRYRKDPNKKALIYAYRNDITYKLNDNLSTSMRTSLQKFKPNYWCYTVLDYNYEQLKQHLESQFTSEMSWDNYGSVWEIDHIIPKNQFQFESYDNLQFKQCWSLSNLRPILKSDNRTRPKDGSDISNEIKQRILKGVCSNNVT